MKAWRHFNTITKHKLLVMKHCFQLGLYKQGLLHDLSKYSWEEFRVGIKYFQGHKSPNSMEREDKGYTSAWLHHKGRNKHHFEYWLDYGAGENKQIQGMKMPKEYVVEMFVDRMCACKNYQGVNYTDESPLVYYENEKKLHLTHVETRALLESLLTMLANKGEVETFKYIKNVVLVNNFEYDRR